MRDRRRVTLCLAEPIFDAFAAFAESAYPDQPFSAAFREAALIAMGTEPLEAARIAARRAAWLTSKVEIATLIGNAMRQAAGMFAVQSEQARAELREMLANQAITASDVPFDMSSERAA